MTAPGCVVLDEDVGMFCDEGGVVGVIEDDNIGVDKCESE